VVVTEDAKHRAMREAEAHARLRWSGALLLPFGLTSLIAHIWLAWSEHEPPGRVMLGVFATLVSLGAFGTNDDSMIAAARRAGAGAGGPDPMATITREVRAEARVRPERVREATAHPRAARILPLVAAAAVGWSWWRIAQGIGGLP
jgi:hypothetical protein